MELHRWLPGKVQASKQTKTRPKEGQMLIQQDDGSISRWSLLTCQQLDSRNLLCFSTRNTYKRRGREISGKS